MIRTASRHDLTALRELFARANDAPYDLARVAEEKCFGDGIAGEALCRVFEEDGRIAGAAVSCGRWVRILAVAPESRHRGIGRRLLADAEARGATRIAAEAGNYFTPGVVESDASTRAFLTSLGYMPGAETWNLEVRLDGIEADGQARRTTREDAPRVLAFIERQFGRIWRFEAEKAFARELPPLFHTEDHGEITGFAAHDVNNAGLGFFGPTGVSTSLRGRGLGKTLLLASLADLRRLGYTKAVIPWTDALAFYEKSCGAKAAHRFIAFERPRS
ncbi:MAG TPA: GNAT family N-acetyltransferase [Thermoanaerobaculia bacterium]|jgi:GNAT superfamily N-acetyltransferase